MCAMSNKTRTPPAITPAQCRAGRALLGWRREDLATASGVPHRTLADFELGNKKPHAATTDRVIAALTAAGVMLIPPFEGFGGGVRLREPEDLAPRPRTRALASAELVDA